MSAASPISFWVIAVAGSIALHGAIGMALYAMPMPETRRPSRTEIDIATLAAGGAQQIAVPENVAVIEVERPAIVVQPPASTLAAKDTGAVTEAIRPQPSGMQAAKVSADVEPASTSATVMQPSEQAKAAPAATETTLDAVPSNPVQALAETKATTQTAEAVAKPDADAPNSPDASTPVQPSLTTVSAVPQPPPAELPASASAERVAAASVETATPLPTAISQMAPEVSEPAEAVASTESATPLIATGNTGASAIAAATVETAKPLPSATPQIAPEAPRAVEAATSLEPASHAVAAGRATVTVHSDKPIAGPPPLSAQTGPLTIAPAGGATVAAPRIDAAPVATPSGGPADGAAAVVAPAHPSAAASSVPPAVVARAPTAVVRTPSAPPPAATGAQVAVLLPRPDVLTDGAVTDGPTSGTLRVAEFLSMHEGDDCLLALPATIGPTQASIQAYAAAPETVGRLGAEYERLSGIKLKTDTKTVSKDQCGALAFARSLAQYPNFPLRVTLAQSTIESGNDLAGVISGLRKDTLYLMVVDDEGKAELVTSYTDQRASLMTFKAPMTLTSGPVSSVQLLVAIASDGPLRTIPVRPGMPAEQYFSKLATEIIAGNRSIAYGITSFVVR
ncbi:hypothetical protein [Mesorhizobium sp. IMUNJ 23232]|uniref:hypothetical protein n=1 Tax=Mesorhizobium sp. IMUNJ 23232 TaxID=3376064 RepID=UPI0037A5C15D